MGWNGCKAVKSGLPTPANPCCSFTFTVQPCSLHPFFCFPKDPGCLVQLPKYRSTAPLEHLSVPSKVPGTDRRVEKRQPNQVACPTKWSQSYLSQMKNFCVNPQQAQLGDGARQRGSKIKSCGLGVIRALDIFQAGHHHHRR